jgi:hypothetical protein
MALLEAFDSLAPFVQLAVVIGVFATIFLVACNRTAATNLITFLCDLYSIHLRKDRRNQQPSHYTYGQQRSLHQRRAGAGNGREKRGAVDEVVELSLPFEAKCGATPTAGREKDAASQHIEVEVE